MGSRFVDTSVVVSPGGCCQFFLEGKLIGSNVKSGRTEIRLCSQLSPSICCIWSEAA